MTAPSIKEALEPCPFCGDSELNFTNLSADATQQFVFCESCHGRSGAGNGREEATQRWNTRALTASPGEQEPPPAAGWNEALRELEAVAEKQKAYFKAKQNEFPRIEDYTGFRGEVSLPDDITPLLKQAEANGRYSEADWWLSTIREALRREAPAPEGVSDDLTPEQISLVNDMIHAWIDPEKIGEFREAFRSDCKRLLRTAARPDAGGGMREALEICRHGLFYNRCPECSAALSTPPAAVERDCEVCGGDCASANPPVAYCPVKERKQCKEAVNKAREMLKLGINIQTTGNATNVIVTGIVRSLLDCIDDLEADLKCAIAVGRMAARPAAAESKASVEARLREALEHYAKEYCEGWCEQDAGCANFDHDCGGCLARRALSEVGDEAKKSEGGTEGRAGRPWPSPKPDAANDEAMASLDRSSPVAGIKPGPSDSTAERREIVARLLRNARIVISVEIADNARLVTSVEIADVEGLALAILAALDGGAGE